MSYKDLPFALRMHVLGDRAETVFEDVVQEHFGSPVRLGWDRPPVSMKHMPDFVRFLPDYYVSSGLLVEVGGVGKDGIVKSMKVKKYEALKSWSAQLRKNGGQSVVWFVWNSHKRVWVFVDWPDLIKLVARAKRENGIQAFENDGNEYYPINWEWVVEAATVSGEYEK